MPEKDLSYEILRSELSARFGAGMNIRFGKRIAEEDLWDVFLDLAQDPDPRIAFRAAWSVEWAYFNDKTTGIKHSERIINDMLASDNQSLLRSYTKMTHDMISLKLISPSEQEIEQLVEKCFDMLISPSVKIAAKVWAMDMLHMFTPRFDWIADHLEAILRQHSEGEGASTAYRSHAGKVLRKMRSQK